MSKISDASITKIASQTATAYVSNNDRMQVEQSRKSRADTKPVSSVSSSFPKKDGQDSKSIEELRPQNKDQQKRINELDNDALSKAVDEANKKIALSNKDFEFAIHEDTKKIMLKVKDSDTGDVIREIPSEKVLDMVAKMWEFAGILVDEKR